MAEPGGIVDGHLHLWDPARLSMGWLRGIPRLDRPVLEAAFVEQASKLGIEAAVLVEAAVDDDSMEAELAWMLEHARGPGPVAGCVVGWRPDGDADATDAWLDRLAAIPEVVGVRSVQHPAGHDVDAPATAARVAAARSAGRRGLVVDLCARPDQLAAVARLLDLAPETTFVLDHLGRPRTDRLPDVAWRHAIGEIARRSNVAVKISALIECAEGSPWTDEAFRPFIETGLDAFGPDRCLWGSNWPVCRIEPVDLDRWVGAASSAIAACTDAERRSVFGGTARRLYGLAAPD